MTLKDIKIRPGVIKDDTERKAGATRGGRRWIDSNRIRFVNNAPEKIGGWEKFIETITLGKTRGALTWLDNAGTKRVALGTHKKLYIVEGLTLINITPIRKTTTPSGPFTTVSASLVVNVDDSSNGASAGDYIEISSASAVGGITLDGNYEIKTIVDGDNYTIEHSVPASSSASGGGTPTIEYEIQVGREDATAGAGYGVGGYGQGTYGTVRTDTILLQPRTWTLHAWGQNLVAGHSDGNIYEWTLDSSVRAAILANAPTNNAGIFVTEEKHLVALGAGGDNMKIEWCSQDANTVWTAADTNTAGGRTLIGGEEIYAGLKTRGTNLIFTDSAVWSMTFIGSLDVFGFQQVSAASSGIIGPHGAVEVDGVVYWMGLNDFYMYDGVVRRITNSKENRRHVFDNLTKDQGHKVYCGANTLFSEVWWPYPTSTENDRYIKYNYDSEVWDVGVIARTAIVDRTTFDNPIMVGADGFIYKHESTNDDDGSAMNEFIVSAPFEIAEGDRIMDILEIIPDMTNVSGSIDLALLVRDYPQDTETTIPAGAVTATTDKLDDFRASGRQAALKIGSSATGTRWRWGTVRMDIVATGHR